MLRRRLTAGIAGVLALSIPVGPVDASSPAGPRIAALATHGTGTQVELATFGPVGGGYRRVLSPRSLRQTHFGLPGGFAWSPDGDTLAFSHHTRRGYVISTVPAAGGPHEIVPGTRGGLLPVFSPDGRALAFARVRRGKRHRIDHYTHWHFESTAVWIVDLATGRGRQLTRWRNDLDHYPMSFSPDGSTLLVNRQDQARSGDLEVVALRFDGRTSGLLVGEGIFPVYSPDGSKIVLSRTVRKWGPGEENLELYTVRADGSHLRRLTRTPHKEELLASWDPSGKRIAYAQFGSRQLDSPNRIMQVNADGTCLTKVLARRGTLFYLPAWQPGPGREAGRIAC